MGSAPNFLPELSKKFHFRRSRANNYKYFLFITRRCLHSTSRLRLNSVIATDGTLVVYIYNLSWMSYTWYAYNRPSRSPTDSVLRCSHAPTVSRQRSYSVPSGTLLEVQNHKMSRPAHSLEEALLLLSKKKLGKAEIDEQSLLHRAANAGNLAI